MESHHGPVAIESVSKATGLGKQFCQAAPAVQIRRVVRETQAQPSLGIVSADVRGFRISRNAAPPFVRQRSPRLIEYSEKHDPYFPMFGKRAILAPRFGQQNTWKTYCAFIHTYRRTGLLVSDVDLKAEEIPLSREPPIRDPNLAEVDKAKDVLSSGDLDRAEAICNEVLKIAPGHAEALHVLGIISLLRERPADALILLNKAVAHAGLDPVLLSNRAESLRRLGRLDEAYSGFEQVLKVDNSNPDAHFNFALLLKSMGDAPKAEHFFRNALMLNGGMARAHYELAELYRQEDHLAQAENEYRAAISCAESGLSQRQPVDRIMLSRWRMALGVQLREFGKTLEAVNELRKAIQADPQSAQAHMELGRASFEMCFEAEAKNCYVTATALVPTIGTPGGGRVISARMAGLKSWGDRRGGTTITLARSQWLDLQSPDVLPIDSGHELMLGRPVTPEVWVSRIENVEILPHEFAVLTMDRHILVDGLVNWPQHFPQKSALSRFSSDDSRVLLDLPSKTQEFDGTCAVLGGAGDHFAWMFECLPRLWALDQTQDGATLPLVVPTNISDERVAMLESIGIGNERLLRLADDSVMSAANVVLPSLLTVGDWVSPIALQFLRRKFSVAPRSSGRRLFVVRNGTSHARLSNEEEVVKCLLQNDFELFNVSEHSQLEVLAAFCCVEAIVAIDDDALANLVVVPQRAKIGVIVAEGNFRPRCFFVSAQLGHNFTYLVGRADFGSNSLHSLCDIELPKPILMEFLGGL